MDKRLKKRIKVIPMLTDLGIKYNRAAGIAAGRVSANEHEADLILKECERVATALLKVTKRGLMQ